MLLPIVKLDPDMQCCYQYQGWIWIHNVATNIKSGSGSAMLLPISRLNPDPQCCYQYHCWIWIRNVATIIIAGSGSTMLLSISKQDPDPQHCQQRATGTGSPRGDAGTIALKRRGMCTAEQSECNDCSVVTRTTQKVKKSNVNICIEKTYYIYIFLRILTEVEKRGLSSRLAITQVRIANCSQHLLY